MTATQAPTPGPLTASDVKLLVKGDLLRRIDGRISIHGLEYESGLSGTYLDGTTHANSPWSNFAFIGRPGPDGWIPWSGGEPTITDPTVDIEVRLRNGELHVDRSPAFDWTYDPEPHPFDIIAFRLAPTAPVASGGQHSSGEDINWKSEWEAVSSLRIKDRAAMAQAVSEIVLDLKVRGYVSHDGDPNWCKEATAWEKIVVRNLSTIPAQPEALSEDDIRRRLIQRIEQWDGETEYDAEDIASLADDILHEFNGAPVLSSSALGYVSADAEAALKAGINRVIYPAPSAHASFPLYASPVPAQEGGAK